MTALQVTAQKQLRQFVEQIERLSEEKKAILSDIRDKFTEAKGAGFDTKVMKKLLAMRRKSKAEVEEEESILDVYRHALDMLGAEARETAEVD